jgi:hypothetical protein
LSCKNVHAAKKSVKKHDFDLSRDFEPPPSPTAFSLTVTLNVLYFFNKSINVWCSIGKPD